MFAKKKLSISLERDDYENLARTAEEQGFASPQELVVCLVKDFIRNAGKKGEAYTAEEEEQVKKRLQDLGYL